MKLRLPAFAAAVAVVAASSCGDPTAIKAEFDTTFDTVEVFAMNGTNPLLPAAIRTRGQPGSFVVRLGGDFNFDIAWDINAAGEAVAYTAAAVAAEGAPVRRVGLLLADGPFDAVTRAPTSGYKYDSLMVVPPGKVLLIDSIDPSCSQFSLMGQNIRAKIQLDSVALATRTLYMRIGANPNCGFRDLVPGLPRE